MNTDKRLLDREWRMNHLYKIRNKDGEIVVFQPNEAQEHFDANRHTRNIILKSRQIGFTTYECIDELDEALFSRKKNIESAVIAHTLDDAEDIFTNKISFAWNNFNEKLQPFWFVDKQTAKRLRFGLKGKDSKIFNTLSVTNSARSGTFSRIHSTELSYLDKHYPRKSEEIIAGAVPALPPSGRFDIESTARGTEGHFYNMCMEAHERNMRGYKPKEKEFRLHFYNWCWDEFEIGKITKQHVQECREELPREFKDIQELYGYTDQQITCYYFYWISLGRNWELLKQEYPNTVEEAFAAKVDILFDIIQVNKQRGITGRKSNNWIYYRDYDASHVYGVGVDVAEGIGRDASAICIWDFTVNEVVATYASNTIPPDILAYECVAGGSTYGNAVVAVERNNHGHATLSKLKEIYPNEKIYKEFKDEKVGGQHTMKWGWNTNGATKPKMFYEMSTAVNEESVKINSENLLSEMRTYTSEQLQVMKATADQTRHWDLLTACVIGWQMRNEKQKIKKPVAPARNDLEDLEKDMDNVWA